MKKTVKEELSIEPKPYRFEIYESDNSDRDSGSNIGCSMISIYILKQIIA